MTSKFQSFIDIFIILLIIYSVITISIETLPGLSQNMIKFFNASEIIITVIFTIEYILRILSSKNKLKFILSFMGIIDLIAILPFYFSIFIDLRGVRVIRLFRVFRIMKLARYNNALDRFVKAIILTKEEIIIFVLATMILLFCVSYNDFTFFV